MSQSTRNGSSSVRRESTYTVKEKGRSISVTEQKKEKGLSDTEHSPG